MDFRIRYLGISVVNVSMKTDVTDDINIFSIKAKTKKLTTIFSKMNNFYQLSYSDTTNFLPDKYTKKIIQSNYKEDRDILYDRVNEKALRKSHIDEQKNKTYDIKADSRDFFSAMQFLRRNTEKDSVFFYLDANSIIWKANAVKIREEKISSKLGKIDTDLFEISFEKLIDIPKERSDMLTNNLVSSDNKLYFWFTKDEIPIPVKAVYEMSPFPVSWVLVKYKN